MDWLIAYGGTVLTFLTGSLTATLLSIYFGGRRQRTELTFKVIEQFFLRHNELGEVLGLLLEPTSLNDPAKLNRVHSLGDWLETIAMMCRQGMIDAALIKKMGIDEQMQSFLSACKNAGQPLNDALGAWTEMQTFAGATEMKKLVTATGGQNGG